MKLIPPFDLKAISQGFGENANGLYANQGLKGHTGIDFGIAYGTPIPSAADSYCYSTANKNNPDLTQYRAVYTIVDEDDFSYEISYGHCSEINAIPTSKYDHGDILGKIGNTGNVFAGQHEVTQQEKLNGSHIGSHLHFQVRKLKRTRNKIDPVLYDLKGPYQRGGYYYNIPEYLNGFNGCIDPAQFFPKFIFTRNLWLGTSGPDVLELQKQLGVDYSSAPGVFGPRTFAAVRAYQASKKISTTGFFGPKTRDSINGVTK